jgi:transketolase
MCTFVITVLLDGHCFSSRTRKQTVASSNLLADLATDGNFNSMTGFGTSAIAEVLHKKFGITAKAVVKAAGK